MGTCHPATRGRSGRVKTTRGPATNAFFVSPSEIRFSEAHPDSYVLVRLYRYSADLNSASYYEVGGPLPTFFGMTPSEFRATLLPCADQS
jgi:Domain of unknown function (DUF3883)